MQVDLSRNYFELFDLPVSFIIDDATLVERYRNLQKVLHPDKFASASDAERRWSLQAASFINEGYQTLVSDLRRAVYLLELNGVSIDEETDTRMAPEFLMQQMDFREALESMPALSDPMDALDKVRRQLKSSALEQFDAFNAAAAAEDWSGARTVARQWQFIDKLSRELKAMEERLDV